MAAARARIHEIARELPAENRFSNAPRHNFNDETQGRIDAVDYAAAHRAYDQQFGAPQPSYGAPQPNYGAADAYDQLPALGHHEHFDAEAPYQQQDPMTELRPAYDEALARHEQRNDGFRSDRPLPEDDSSGEYARRERRSPPPPATYSAASNSYDPAAYEANYPKAPRQEPSYADRRDAVSSAPKSDRRERDERRDDGRSFRRDDFPRESSYRDEPRRDERRDSDRDRDREDRRDEGRSFRREERANSYQPPARADETRAEGSSAKHEAKRDGNSYRDRDQIPGPAPVPRELRVPENFVVGVQPIRPANTPSMGAPQAYPQPQAVIAPSYPPAMTAAASPGAMNMNMPMSPLTGGPSLGQMGMPIIPQISMPPMMAPLAPMTAGMSPMHIRAHTSARPPGHVPQMTEVEEAQQGSKVGRFAWFVFGAAFGIFFAFAATGFGFGKKEEPAPFPPAPTQLPTAVQTQPPAPPPPVAPPSVAPQAPVAAPGAQPPVMLQPAPGQPVPQMQPPQPQTPGLAPAVAPMAPPPGVLVAPNQNVGPIVPAPGGPQQQPQQAGQPAPSQPQAGARPPSGGQGTVVVRGGGGGGGGRVRRGGGGGGARPAAQPRGDDDDAPAPKPSKKDPDVADLLGDGLK